MSAYRASRPPARHTGSSQALDPDNQCTKQMPESFLISQNAAVTQFVCHTGAGDRGGAENKVANLVVASSSHARTSSVNKGDSVSRTRA